MADIDARQPPTNGATPTATSTRTPTHTYTSPDDDNGSTVKLSTGTHQLLRELRRRSGNRRNDAIILKALRLLDQQLEPAIPDDVWANS